MEITKVRDFIIRKSTDTVNPLEFTPVAKSLFSFIGSFILTDPFVSDEFAPFAISLVAASCLLDDSVRTSIVRPARIWGYQHHHLDGIACTDCRGDGKYDSGDAGAGFFGA